MANLGIRNMLELPITCVLNAVTALHVPQQVQPHGFDPQLLELAQSRDPCVILQLPLHLRSSVTSRAAHVSYMF